MSVADLMEAMSRAGAPMEAIVMAIRALEEKDAAIRAAEQETADKRAAHAEWKRLNRAAKKAMDGPSDVHGLSMDETENPPVLDKETSPRPPKEINPTPRVGIALARKAAGFGPPEAVEVGLWNEFCSQRKKSLTPKAYEMITAKLSEGAEAGWPPGDLIARAIERGWETVFIPDGKSNGQSGQLRMDGKPDLRGARPDPSLDLLYASRAAEAEELSGTGWQDNRGAWSTLPAVLSG